ncbi:hypothetical protein ASPTUDRAFT_705923 [Aspergillus tubingensis CBS 134.48]|uniref:Secreted protein n=1 Tax=Aspergillus tubingensis (strain CBS 134.48) TaxID=767770 RepID=A0A1L9N277_ASPTC|nr:hypothetical protein ASPTUDRAFT_705923 [Aspergillus tubingensis CBS 134.48]
MSAVTLAYLFINCVFSCSIDYPSTCGLVLHHMVILASLKDSTASRIILLFQTVKHPVRHPSRPYHMNCVELKTKPSCGSAVLKVPCPRMRTIDSPKSISVHHASCRQVGLRTR